MRFRFRNYWTLQRLVGALLLTLAGIVAGIEAWRDILHIAARDEEASHVFLVPIVVAFLIWVRRMRWRHVRPGGYWLGPVLIVLGWVFYDIGDARLWQSVWHFSAILIMVGCLVSGLGSQVLRQFLPAFLVLAFMVPVPGRVRQRIAIPMQNATARATEDVFNVVGIDVQRQGSVLNINGKDVAIAEACNGLRMVFALTLVCYAFAFGSPLRWYARLLVMAATPFAAILCNVIRLVPTVYVYGNYSSTFAEDFHFISGWAMLFIAFFLLLGTLRVLRWAYIPVYQFTLAYD
jgi:exosortase